MLEEFDNYDETLKDKRKTCLIAGSFFLVILLVFFAAGCFLLVRQIQASQYLVIESVVVDYKIVYVDDNRLGGRFPEPNYFNIVEYEMDGKTYRKTCDTPASKNTPPDTIGKIITIYVNPHNPEDVIFRNSTHIILTVACLVVPTIGFVVIGFVFRHAHKIKQML